MATKPKQKLSNSDKKELAKLLFTSNNLSQKEIATRVDITEATMSKWVNEEMWEDLKKSLQVTKDEQLRLMYKQLSNLNEDVMNEEGKGYPDSKQANTQKMLAASIRELETETNIGQIIQVAMEFTKWVPGDTNEENELRKTIVRLFDDFIKHKMKRA